MSFISLASAGRMTPAPPGTSGPATRGVGSAVQAELLVGTDRAATMHERLAHHAARHLPIDITPPPIRIPPLVEYAQWNRARSQDPGLRWLVQRIVTAARSV